MRFAILITLILFSLCGKSQTYQADSLSGFNTFFIPSESPNKGRLTGVGATIGTVYAGASVALYNIWYKDFPLGKFRSFNDNGEWLQMDKGGHGLSAYYETVWAYGLYNWAGLEENKAIMYSAITSTVVQSTIEIFDGFSEEWGFSWGDVAANTFGTGLAAGQQLAWGEQRMMLKVSFHPQQHEPDLEARALELYGSAFTEKLFKDYNGLTYWFSLNPSSFMSKDNWFPDWLNVAVGYGANNLYGGFANQWCSDSGIKPEDCPDEQLIIRNDVPRQRQYYLSLDIDFTKIETQKPFLKTLFGVIGVLKIPSPTLELRQGEGLKGHWIYF
ncbi:MAG: hypothetical protein ACI959_000724 [Limisphaerales bacterium]|jgi:hypothetical protein